MIKDASLVLIFIVLVIAVIAFGRFIIRRKRQQMKKQRDQLVSESLVCPECGAEFKPLNGSQDTYECPNCNQPNNLGQEVNSKCRL